MPEPTPERLTPFDFGTQCCFCGEDNRNDPIGYAGERCCSKCGKGGHGEPDEPQMAYRANLLPKEYVNGR